MDTQECPPVGIMSKKVIVALLVGIALGVLISPHVLASGNEETNEHEWCYRNQFDNSEALDEYRKGDDTFNVTFIKMNGRKLQVYTKCEVSPPTPPLLSILIPSFTCISQCTSRVGECR